MDELEHLRTSITLSGDTGRDVATFLNAHGCPETAMHCGRVAAEARRVATLCGADPDRAETAGWLHDVSAVIPSADRACVARAWGIDVLPEEDLFPMIVHQKLSVVLARDVFGVHDAAVLSAVGCHTTLKRDANRLDKVLFVADKLEWDQAGSAPFHADMHAALRTSLDTAVGVYLTFLWERRANLRVLHPWLRDAYEQWIACYGG